MKKIIITFLITVFNFVYASEDIHKIYVVTKVSDFLNIKEGEYEAAEELTNECKSKYRGLYVQNIQSSRLFLNSTFPVYKNEIVTFGECKVSTNN